MATAAGTRAAIAARRMPFGAGGEPPRICVGRIEDRALMQNIGAHTHEFFTIMLVERGGGWHVVGADARRTSAGDLFVIAPDEVHDASGLDDTRGWVVKFMPDALVPNAASEPEYTPLPGDPRWLAFVRQACTMGSHYLVPAADRLRWRHHFVELADELENRRPGYEHALRSRLALLLVDASRVVLPNLEPLPAARHAVVEVFQVIDGRYAEDISLDDVARAVARSPSHLSRLVRRATGETVMHWIEERRMVEARRLLIETDDKIAAVARGVGYRDPSYFRRRFRRAHGIPPAAWRELNR